MGDPAGFGTLGLVLGGKLVVGRSGESTVGEVQRTFTVGGERDVTWSSYLGAAPLYLSPTCS